MKKRREILSRRSGLTLVRVALLAGAYALTGKLSLMLAIPPGYASPVFPPAGIGLAALLLWGRQYWVGVWLGSFLLNWWTSAFHVPGVSYALAVALAAAIGCGAALQALLGNGLIKRYVSQPLALVRSADILRFVLLAGLLSSLVNSTLSVTSLLLLNVISPSAYLYSWWNWWVGDSLGILVFVPILLTFFAKPRGLWSKRRYSVALPLSVALALSTVIFLQAAAWERKGIAAEFERLADNAARQVQNNFEGYLDSLYGLENVMVDAPLGDLAAFRRAAKRWLSLYSGIYDFSWIPRVPYEKRAEFEKAARKNGMPFVLRELSAEGTLIDAPYRPEYFPSYFVEPYRVNENVLGFDHVSSPVRYKAMEQARDSGNPTATAPTRLLQIIPSHSAILVFLPIYHGARDTLEERRKNLKGFVKAVFRMPDVIEASTMGLLGTYVKLAIYDETSPHENPLYSQFELPSKKDRNIEEKGHSTSMSTWETTVKLADRTYWLKVAPTDVYWSRQRDYGPWMILCSELMMSGLLVCFLLAVSGQSITVEQELLERKRISHQLSRSNSELEQFAYVASHDLQEPLRMISSYVQLIEKRLAGSLDKDTLQFMEFVTDGAKRMRSLINDLLDYSRVGRTGMSPEPMDSGTILTPVLQDLQVSIKESQAEIHVGAMPTLRMVRAEATQLFQNLIGNAIKYRDKNRKLVVEISARKESEGWLFSVRDNGIGIGEEYRYRVFQMFQRLHLKGQYPGTGIGLAICKKIVEGVGGRIWVESKFGEGSNFQFILPLDCAEPI